MAANSPTGGLAENATRGVGTGSLGRGALTWVLRGLRLERLTGVLELRRGDVQLALRWVSGEIVGGSSNALPLRLGEILVRSGRLSRTDLDRALAIAISSNRRLGVVLLELGLIGRGRLEATLAEQARQVLCAALGWADGEYLFFPDDAAIAGTEDVCLRLPTTRLIFEATRRVESLEALLSGLGELDRPLRQADEAPLDSAGAVPADAYVLSRVDGRLTAQQIIDTTPLPPRDVAGSLLGGLATGAVSLDGGRPSCRPGLASAEPPVPATEVADPRLEEVRKAARDFARAQPAEILGVSATAPPEDIRRAYTRLVRRFHPDAFAREEPRIRRAAHEAFVQVVEAYRRLTASAPAPAAVASRRTGLATAGPPKETLRPEPPPPAAEPPLVEPDIDTLLDEAAGALGAGRHAQARASLRRVRIHGSSPQRLRARLLLARALHEAGETREAEAELRAALEEDSGSVEAHFALGQLYRDQGLLSRSASHLRIVLSLQPTHPGAQEALQAVAPPPSPPPRLVSRLLAWAH